MKPFPAYAISPESDGQDEIIDDRILAQRLGLVPDTLQAWRRQGKGPKFLKLGRAVRYRMSDVNEWLEARIVGSGEYSACGTRGGNVR